MFAYQHLAGKAPSTLLTITFALSTRNRHSNRQSNFAIAQKHAMFQKLISHMRLEEGIMKATTLPEQPDAKSPAGADIRFIMDGETGNMIHSTVPPHQINKATVHATVSEFWYVLEGHGEIWRDNGLESCVTILVPGTSIDIPVGTAFQYRNVSDLDLKFICITMPPWPGDSEATYLNGKWQPTI